jgi:hypothetical protein
VPKDHEQEGLLLFIDIVAPRTSIVAYSAELLKKVIAVKTCSVVAVLQDDGWIVFHSYSRGQQRFLLVDWSKQELKQNWYTSDEWESFRTTIQKTQGISYG